MEEVRFAHGAQRAVGDLVAGNPRLLELQPGSSTDVQTMPSRLLIRQNSSACR